MKRYSVFAIAREAMRYHTGWERAWRSPEPKKQYDAIIIGGGKVSVLNAILANGALVRVLDQLRSLDERPPAPGLVQGWMVEPVLRPDRQLWVWGAGHVGRALASVLSPLPGVVTTWVDVGRDRFPADMPTGVSPLWDADPARLVALAPKHADHLIVTFSHALDLDLCHRLLGHGFRSCGLIGSASKWARFRSRLGALGHAPAALGRIDCPIGDPALGKHPQAIAVGVALRFLGAAQGSPRATSQTA